MARLSSAFEHRFQDVQCKSSRAALWFGSGLIPIANLGMLMHVGTEARNRAQPAAALRIKRQLLLKKM